jgi:hypothetical protein
MREKVNEKAVFANDGKAKLHFSAIILYSLSLSCQNIQPNVRSGVSQTDDGD